MFEEQRAWDLPVVGRQTTRLTGHDEIHSLTHLNVPNIRFWMGFSDHYINVFTVLNSSACCPSNRCARPRASRSSR